jgi:hypothetical protein
VREETGLDITGMLVEEDCIERHIKQQRSKLYIITGVCYGHPYHSVLHRSLLKSQVKSSVVCGGL